MYTAEEKQRMERVLAGFGKYIEADKNFDICYSNKLGYLFVSINSKAEVKYTVKQIEGLDDLLYKLFYQLSEEVRYKNSTGKYHDDIDLFPEEIVVVRLLAMNYIYNIDLKEDVVYCLNRLEHYLEHVND